MAAFELPVWRDPNQRAERLSGWLCGRYADFLPFLPALLLVPLLAIGLRDRPQRSRWRLKTNEILRNQPGDSVGVAWMMGAVVFFTTLLASRWVGNQFAGLPPAYHDEYSYVFQAETYLAGRWSFPSFEPRPELFDQMHVLNEGRFASRYFPGVGAWIAPFLYWGDPWLGHQLAQALTALLAFWIGRELSCAGVGLLAGLLVAVSPGLLLFSNLLLAHHPTLVGLFLFLFCFLKWQRTSSVFLLTAAGVGLSYAMLCRPMTAAGFGLPFGVLFFARQFQAIRKASVRDAVVHVLALGTPIFAGLCIAAYANAQITGSPWLSPYQLYTDTYTPRHVYGFNNRIRGEQNLGPKVLKNYDDWAENLTPSLAARNAASRMENSFRWTLGIIPLSLGLLVFVLSPGHGDSRWWQLLFATISLHLVHIPYWFTGIMGWHYVFESAPLLILLFAESTRRLMADDRTPTGRTMAWTPILLLAVAVPSNLWTVSPLWPGRLPQGMAEIRFPREKYAVFHDRVDQLRDGTPAMVFVIPDQADRHIDYVVNSPDLSADVLIGRAKSPDAAEDAAALFPDRIAWRFDAHTGEFKRITKNPPARSQ
ncbi:MAG: hypothetical protein KDA80_21620 [Planctomycetaceae bacterium]|nr:hypothetical protein [Planctomycetaceae bacterium]